MVTTSSAENHEVVKELKKYLLISKIWKLVLLFSVILFPSALEVPQQYQMEVIEL